ncbi:hypothetical protein [Kitasatospora sp. NBC_01300]|uniref:hypothetical protein n=1 Tax=Kitasatospora sp. NBC_01300 TaxID=2903574 RepID=UPI002F90F327|nr:hypothetical protein OG556_38820 [Kitasatospora sp. NBC_01300]
MTHEQERDDIAHADRGRRPSWTEEMALQTVDSAGAIRHVTVYIGAPSAALITLIDADSCTEISGADYLDCLTQARRQLEQEGRRLCCQGARPNVHPSGQLRQFTNGREAYVHPSDAASGISETADIFAPALPEDVVRLDEQRAAILASWNARSRTNPI